VVQGREGSRKVEIIVKRRIIESGKGKRRGKGSKGGGGGDRGGKVHKK